MASQVDVTFPADNVKVSKATFRAQMVIIYNEITALQTKVSVAVTEAYNSYASTSQVTEAVANHVVVYHSLARDIAFDRVSL